MAWSCSRLTRWRRYETSKIWLYGVTTAEAVDSFQYQVQDRIWWKKHLYDFNDFVECVDNVWKSCLMATEDFFDFKSYKSKAKYINYLKLAKISEVQFCKGETKMFWKTLFEKSEYRSCELLQKKFREECLLFYYYHYYFYYYYHYYYYCHYYYNYYYHYHIIFCWLTNNHKYSYNCIEV